MAIARLDTAASAAATTLAFSVSAGSERMLVVAVGNEDGVVAQADSVDYGGQAMVLANEFVTPDTGFHFGCAIWYLLDAGIAAASGSTITPTYSVAVDDEMIHAISYTGVDQTGGSTTNPANNQAESNEATPNPLISDLTETDEGVVVAIRGSGNVATHTWASDLTEQTEQAAASSGSSMADRLSTTSGNVNVEGTSSNQNRGCQVVSTFAPAAGVSLIAGAVTLTFSDGATVSGTGELQGAETIAFSNAANLRSVQPISASESITFSPVGAIAAVGKLEGLETIAFTSSADLNAKGQLQGAVTLVLSMNGVLVALGQLQAAETITFSDAAGLLGTGQLQAAETILFTPVGDLKNVAASQTQDQYRWGDDDGSESAYTFIADQNNDISRQGGINTILRIQINNTGDLPGQQIALQVKRTTGPASEYRKVPVAA